MRNSRGQFTKGNQHPPEVVDAISRALRGKPSWNKGISPSKETKEKLRVFNTGKRHTIETKKILSEMFKGERHYNWKGGISPLAKIIRRSFLYRQWRSDVYTRDDFTCQICLKRGGDLNADHFPKTFAFILQINAISSVGEAERCPELWDINNGRTLCVPCHRTTY